MQFKCRTHKYVYKTGAETALKKKKNFSEQKFPAAGHQVAAEK